MSKIFVIGDIHGCYDELAELINMANVSDDDLIIALGDIVDRGNKSKEVYTYLKARPNSIVLMGNHERKHLNGILSYAQEIVKVQFGEEYDELIKWIENLPYFYETEDAIIVHAAFEHDKQLFNQEENVLSGTTSGERYLEKKYGQGKYWSDFYNGSKPAIYGHHVVGDIPKIKNNTYGIDTGACHGGYLTAIELPGFKVYQVKAKKDYWKQEQEEWQIPVLKSKGWNDMELADIRKQLAKLDYIENPEVKNLLQKIDEWLEKSTEQIMRVKAAIDELAQSMLVKPDDFNLLASKYSFGRFLFMSRANKLKVEELQKVFNTPYAIKNISEELNLSFEEIRL